MLREIGPGENGFINDGNVEFSRFPDFLQKHVNMSLGIGLADNQVPQTLYWLYVDNKPAGYGKLRHYLNDSLRKIGGHIGYAIRPSERGKGYGKLILKKMLVKAKENGIYKVLMTTTEDNILSRKVIEGNGGLLSHICHGECYYWIAI
jgi:predicted acetyltransferase